MTEEELRKFDKETFVQYFARNLHSDYLRDDLERIQHRRQFDARMEQSDDYLQQMRDMGEIKTFDEMAKHQQLWKKYQAISKKTDKMLGIQLGENSKL